MNDAAAGVPTCYRHPDRESYISCQRCERTICPDCMREAAVGFQCPSCVSQGAKETRSGRTAYGGIRSAQPGLTSMVLIGINVAVWLGIVASGWTKSRLIDMLALIPSGQCGSIDQPGGYYPGVNSEAVCTTIGDGRWDPGVIDGAFWQLLTNAFTHVQLWHIGFNMLALWFLGPQLESALGRTRFLALYLLSALSGSVAVFWLAGEHSATLGASGAVFGLLGALLVIGHKVGGDISGLWGWLGINALLTFIVPNVSWQGHLGGLIGGALVAAILVYAPRERRSLIQAGGLVALGGALAVATVVRVLMLS